jgi:FemAB-related protein (PEP-CTERM system-associated)
LSDHPSVLRVGRASSYAWDRFVFESPDSSFCHLSGWRDIMAAVLGHECFYLAAIDDDGRWSGVLPLVQVRSSLFGRYLVSMPFLNYGGPIGSASAQEQLAKYALQLARSQNAALLELRNREHVAGPLEINPRKVTVVLPLPPAAGELFQNFPSKLRSQIRRPQKAGFETRFGLDQVDPFYSVFSRNMRDLGTPVMPRAWFEAIAREFPQLVQFGVVYQGTRPAAAGCGFVWRDEFEMTWASSLREYNGSAPNMLLYWSFMDHVLSRGVRRFNFGRCTPGSGTHRFKLQWGATDEVLPWAQWSPVQVRTTPSPERPAYRVASAVWRRLPLTVTNTVGPALARMIP